MYIPEYFAQVGKIHARDQRATGPLGGQGTGSPTIPHARSTLPHMAKSEGTAASQAVSPDTRAPWYANVSSNPPHDGNIGWLAGLGWVGDNMTRLRPSRWAAKGKTCFGPDRPSPQPIGGRGGHLAAAKNGARGRHPLATTDSGTAIKHGQWPTMHQFTWSCKPTPQDRT